MLDTELPEVLCELVEEFQTFMKKQKETIEELGRFSSKPLKSVGESITAQDQVSLSLAGNCSLVM